MKSLLDWLDDRTGYRASLRDSLDEDVLGGARFVYVFGSVLLFLIVLQLVSGIFLAMYYSPSRTDAWASVAYIQDQVAGGWFVRGLHSHGASAVVILAGLHLLQTAVFGAYKKPRELNWIVGVFMLGIILAFALTGYLLPGDQTGYSATEVALGIAGSAPLVGQPVQEAIQGGNAYGNLTFTRFFAIHVFLLPGILLALIVFHLKLFRRHHQTPPWWLDDKELARRSQPFWPDQLFRDFVAMAIVLGILIGVVTLTHGAPLDAPADPSVAFDARPEWYFRPLFQALKYFQGPLEAIATFGAPAVFGGFLILLPFLDRGGHRNPRDRLRYLLCLGALGGSAVALGVLSYVDDANNPDFAKNTAKAHRAAQKARALAKEYGVPESGDVFSVEPGYAGRRLFLRDCASCHTGQEREAPEIGAGYNSRQWIADFFRDPNGDKFFGRTKIDDMEAVEATGEDFAGLVELVYAQTGAEDIDADLVKRGQAYFDDQECSDCHSIDWDSEGEEGPNLGRRGSPQMLREFILNPGHPRWFGEKNEMPDSRDVYTEVELASLVEYLVLLRDADAGEEM